MTPQRGDAAAPTNASAQFMAAVVLSMGAMVLGVFGILVTSLPALLGSAALGAVALFLLPRNALPALALWLLVLFPGSYLRGVPTMVGAYMTPAVVVIAIWILRLALAQRMTLLLRMPFRGSILAAPLLVLIFASAVFSIDVERTTIWTAVLIVCVVAPALVGQICLDDVWPPVRRTLAGIGLFLGILAASDRFIHFNPWTPLYEHDFSWTSTFRTSTSLGHPLTTALVACVALAVCVFPTSNTRQWPYWICAVGASIALILTVSRTSVIAFGVSAIVGILSGRPRTSTSVTRGPSRLTLLLLAAALFAAITLSPFLSQRNASEEGSTSASYRSQLLDTASRFIGEHPLFGFGPGTSSEAYEYASFDSLENSALQLLVSVGIPAFLFFVAGLGTVVAVAMRRSQAGVAAGIVAFCISATGFNIVDSSPAIFALIAPLIVCAVMPGPGRSEPPNGKPEAPEETAGHPAGGERLTPRSKIKQ